MNCSRTIMIAAGIWFSGCLPVAADSENPPKPLLGQGAKGDWTSDAPGVRRKITTGDLPAPFETKSIDNGPKIVPRPADAWPKVSTGFTVKEFAKGLDNPRCIVTAPNGDIFVAESRPGRIRLLRDSDGDGVPEENTAFASNLRQPFGIAFYPPGSNPTHVYVANTDSVVRFEYQTGDLKARGAEEMIVSNISGGGRLRGGGHWTRDIVFSQDGKRMFVSVGSKSNNDDSPVEERRARIFEYTPDGKNERVFAYGIRNAVGLAIHPKTGELWASVNERDGLGDDLVPEYITHVQDEGFYGWPWFYLGPNEDPRHKGKKPELKDKVIVPDVLVQSHSASLDMIFYEGKQFPKEFYHDAFAAEHGSWNRAKRTGYKVIRVPLKDGKATGEYEDFMTGFVTADGNVWGRPVGVCQAKDGSLMVSDDGSNMVWQITYKGETGGSKDASTSGTK